VNAKIRKKLSQGNRRIELRLNKNDNSGSERPMITASNIDYQIADRTRAVAAGGLGAMHLVARKLGLAEAIDRRLQLLKVHLPYHESDHVLNMAYNLLAGGACLEHLELRRNDEVYLDALGARRIPDPTTAGDFCRRFAAHDIDALQEVFNETRLKVWRQQPDAFFDEAVLEADGTMVETTGECKQGMDVNYQGQWGYHPLMVSLANTAEPLYLVNRSGNRPSHEGAAEYFDKSIALCRRAGFRKIKLRGDTDFTQTAHLDDWDDQGDVWFVFGMDAMPNLYEIAENLPQQAWKQLRRRAKYKVRTTPRARPANVKEQVVRDREFENLRLVKEYVAEFEYSPTLCQKTYRVVVVWKDLEVAQGQKKLFDDARCFFYITNDRKATAEEIVFDANDRSNQENLIQQHKSGVRSLTAPVDTLVSNWAYMVMAGLAWSLKAWAALLLPETGRWKERRGAEKRRLLRMDFATFCHAMIQMPAQIVHGGRRIVYRLLSWSGWQQTLFRLLDQLRLPLRC
jgi:Transposase DDE domain group 1